MKFILTICLLLAVYAPVLAQTGNSLDVDAANSGNNTVRFNNPSGSDKKIGDVDIEDISGSPYYSQKWSYAVVVLTNDKQVNLPRARLNLYNNELHFIDSLGVELVVDDRNIKKVFLREDKDSGKISATFYVIQNYNGKQGGTYMQVLNQGAIELLKINAVQLIKKDYDAIRGKYPYAFQQNVSYAFLNKGAVVPVKNLNITEVFSALSPDAQANTWLAGNKNKLKSEKDVTAFLGWYNSTTR